VKATDHVGDEKMFGREQEALDHRITLRHDHLCLAQHAGGGHPQQFAAWRVLHGAQIQRGSIMAEVDLFDAIFMPGDLSPRRACLGFAEVMRELAAIAIRHAGEQPAAII
jgi:hypothetical protein